MGTGRCVYSYTQNPGHRHPRPGRRRSTARYSMPAELQTPGENWRRERNRTKEGLASSPHAPRAKKKHGIDQSFSHEAMGHVMKSHGFATVCVLPCLRFEGHPCQGGFLTVGWGTASLERCQRSWTPKFSWMEGERQVVNGRSFSKHC